MIKSKVRKCPKATKTARRDMLDLKCRPKQMHVSKYSSPCNYSSEFRCRIYEINPYDLSCVYKIMFEKSATNTLLDFSTKYTPPKEKEKADVARPLSPGTETPKLAAPLLDIISQTVPEEKCIDGWSMSSFSNTATHVLDSSKSYTAYKKDIERRSLSLPSRLISSKDDSNRNAKAANSKPTDRPVSSSVSLGSSYHQFPNRIVYVFKHYDDIHNYINQYRLDYTYRRMNQLKHSLVEYPNHYSSASAPQYGSLRLHDSKEAFSPARVASAVITPSLSGSPRAQQRSPQSPGRSPPCRPMTSTATQQIRSALHNYRVPASSSSQFSETSTTGPTTTSPASRTGASVSKYSRTSPKKLCAIIWLRNTAITNVKFYKSPTETSQSVTR
ncbi:putative protein TPRXL isoform X2 [Gigantopelta aegis]|uniref:putative protein TPRXL isoform X2 n=1 Tax=Gigantopelta aegis TaxID=1735272 RepID=UPI001B889B3B|nr:putative protein TPRXL isoform X2 [Gigantopelta aegis]